MDIRKLSMNKKIELLYCIDSKSLGGAEKHLLDLVKNIDSSKFKTTVVCPPKKNLDAWVEQLKEYSHVLRRPIGFFGQIFLYKLYRDADIVHFQMTSPSSCLFGIIGTNLSKDSRFIATVHLALPNRSSYPFKTDLASFNLRLVDKVIAVSESTARILEKTFSVNPSRITTVYNGVDVNLYSQASKEDIVALKKGLNLDLDVPIIGSVGRFTKQKGFEFLIKAVPHVVRKINNVKFLIIGTGELESKLKHLTKKHRVENNFRFLGYREDVCKLLPVFDIFVLPSLWEGFPLTILEAMSTTLPVVASSIHCNKEAIEDGKTGLLVPPKDPSALGDAIIFLLENREKALEMGRQGRKRIEKDFYLDLMIENTEKIYFELLTEKEI